MSRAQNTMDQDIAEEVAAFLRANPQFLAENPELYHVLTPPIRVHGEALTDHMVAMIRVERANAAQLAARTEGMVVAGRAASGLAERVQGAVVALMRAPDPIEYVTIELPSLLGIDAATLCLEYDWPGTRTIPEGTIDRLLGGRDAMYRHAPTETRLLHGEAAGLARADALVRVEMPGRDGLLALAARDRKLLHREQGAGALVFLGQALSASLERRDQ